MPHDHGDYPPAEVGLTGLLADEHIEAEMLTDGWGRPLRYERSLARELL